MPISATALPMKEAQEFWRGKTAMTRADWDTLDASARTRAFTVSGIDRLDQLGEIHAAIQKAQNEGMSLGQFKKQIGPILDKAGITSKRRAELIFRTNMGSAYAAGRFAQMKKVAARRPYWRYVAVSDRRTRPGHRALHGLVYPHDHEFWSNFYPPNGFLCRCSVQSLSERQVKARGEIVQREFPDRRVVRDPQTGAEHFVTPMPDKGWSTNIGQDWLAGLAPDELAGPLKDIKAKALCRDGRGMFAEDRCKLPLATLDPHHIHKVKTSDIMPKGLKPKEYVLAFLKEFGLKDIDASTVHRLPGNVPVVVSKQFFIDKQTRAWKVEKSGREQFMRLLARTILDPYEIWRVPAKLSGRPVTVLRLIRLFQTDTGKVGGFAVFNLIKGRQWKAATTFTPKTGNEERMLNYLEGQRKGELIYREKSR